MANTTNSQIGAETTLHYWNSVNSPSGWVKLGQVERFGPLVKDSPEVDVTDLDSDQMEFIPGLKTGREVTITLYCNATNLALLEQLYDDADNIDLKATFPSPTNLRRYFTLTPLGVTQGGEVTPTGVLLVELRGRISTGPSSTNLHSQQ